MTWAKGAEFARKRREQSRQSGLCMNCHRRVRIIDRTQCEVCTIAGLTKEAFKYDRRRKMPNSTQARGTCYVEQYAPPYRKAIIDAMVTKWDGRCHYTGLPIELGATASIDHQIPVSKVGIYGASRVFSVENLVWTHRAFNNLKGNMTADEFRAWLRTELLPVLSSHYFAAPDAAERVAA